MLSYESWQVWCQVWALEQQWQFFSDIFINSFSPLGFPESIQKHPLSCRTFIRNDMFEYNKNTNNKRWLCYAKSTLACDNLRQGTAELFLGHIWKGKWPECAVIYRMLTSDPGPHGMLSDLLTLWPQSLAEAAFLGRPPCSLFTANIILLTWRICCR